MDSNQSFQRYFEIPLPSETSHIPNNELLAEKHDTLKKHVECIKH